MLIVSHLNADTANFAIRNQKITKVVYLALARIERTCSFGAGGKGLR